MEMIIGVEDAAFLVGTGGKTKDKAARVAGASSTSSTPTRQASAGDLLRTRTGERRSSTWSGCCASAWVPSRWTPVVREGRPVHRERPAGLRCVRHGQKRSRASKHGRNTARSCSSASRRAAPRRASRSLILGSRRSRRGAELKVMSAEHKRRGFFVMRRRSFGSGWSRLATARATVGDDVCSPSTTTSSRTRSVHR